MGKLKIYFFLLAIGCFNKVYGEILIDENYEVSSINELTTKGWDYIYNSGSETLSIANNPVHSGNKALQMRYDGIHCPNGICEDSHNSKIAKTFSNVDEIFERFYIRYENNGGNHQFVSLLNASSKQHYFNPGGADPVSTVLGFFYTEGAADNLAFALQSPFGTSIHVPKVKTDTLTTGQWYCVQTQQKMNRINFADGIMRIWINGELTLEYTDLSMRNSDTSHWKYLQIYRQGADNLLRYEDDYILATEKVDCVGASEPNLKPKSPTGLRVKN